MTLRANIDDMNVVKPLRAALEKMRKPKNNKAVKPDKDRAIKPDDDKMLDQDTNSGGSR